MENTISTESIMAQIKQEIKEKGLAEEVLSFEDVPYNRPNQTAGGEATLEAAGKSLAYMNAHYYVQPYKPLAGSKAKVFIKKSIRKLTKFYVEPIVFEQNDFNANAVSVLSSIKGFLEKHDPKALEKRIEVLEEQQSLLLGRIDQLEAENAALRSKGGRKGRK